MCLEPALRCAALMLVLAGLPALASPASAGDPERVVVQIGPSPIPGGTASGPRDITLANSKLAVTFAVDTAAPWGVPRGGILDAAVVREGVIGPDRLSLFDFLPDGWSKWIGARARVEVLQDDGRTARLRTTRQWRDVRIVTEWRLDAGSSTLAVDTQMHNEGPETLQGIRSGHVLWPDGGYLFAPSGLQRDAAGPARSASAPWSAAYGEDWLLALHAPYAKGMRDEGRDRYLEQNLAPGAARRFEAWFQVEGGSSLAPVVAAETGYSGLPSGHVAGHVTTLEGATVDAPAVVVEVEQHGGYVPYAWTMGRDGQFSIELPAGHYRIYATARGHSRSRPFDVELTADSRIRHDFGDLQPPGELRIHVLEDAGGRPLDARISAEQAEAPLIRTLGERTWFTELDPAGQVRLALAPGDYRFRVESSAGFTARPAWLEATVTPGGQSVATARIEVLAEPAAEGWYGGDMHHHSDVLDGLTAPGYVLRSQLAAGLDITLLTDHDSVTNNAEMGRLAALRGLPFIAGTELSPSWAHFNAYPLEPGRTIDFDPELATVQEIFDEARQLGAEVVQVNHPWLSYGYFHTADAGQVPGGYSEAFDLIEITANDLQANSPTIHRAWDLWNAGQRTYFSAGSDAHDVWQDVSGFARMYVKVAGRLDTTRYVAALKRGNAYATTGPLVFPETLFGDELRHPAGTPLKLAYRFQSVNGLVTVRLIERGREIEARRFEAPRERVDLNFETWPEARTWYSVVAEDAAGKFLASNPVWVTTVGAEEAH